MRAYSLLAACYYMRHNKSAHASTVAAPFHSDLGFKLFWKALLELLQACISLLGAFPRHVRRSRQIDRQSLRFLLSEMPAETCMH